MTIDQAIALLENFPTWYHDILDFDDVDAVKMGIAALKVVKSRYDPDHQMLREQLPGETAE